MKKTAMQNLWDWIDKNHNEDNFNIYDAMRLSLEEENKEHVRIYDHAFGYGVKSSQTEISDEQIEKAARDYDNGDIYGPPLLHFEQGAFWYREQLKPRQ